MNPSQYITSLLIAGASWGASASVLFENAVVASLGGNNHFTVGGVIGAEDFSLGAAATVDKIAFNAYHSPGQPLVTTIDWAIRSGGSSTPGAVIASGTSGYTNVFVQSNSGYDLLDYVLDIPDQALLAGDYWVTFHLNGNIGDPHWTITSTGNGLSAISFDSGGSWSNNYPGDNMAFRIEGVDGAAVPEPMTLALVGLALAGVAASRRTRPTR